MVCYSHLLKNFPQLVVIYTLKGFGVINEAEVDVFLEFSCFFNDPLEVGNLISGSSAFPKSNLNTCKFTVHVLLKPGLENFEHYFTSMWDECNCAVIWTFFGIALLWDWNENWPFSVLQPLLSFPNLLAYWVHLFVVMHPKAHLTWHSRMYGFRLVIKPSWLSGSWRSLLYCSSVHSCHLFLISSASVRSIPFLSSIVTIFAWTVPLVSLIFLKRSCLSHSTVYSKSVVL